MTRRYSVFAIAWAGFMTLVIAPVIAFDIVTIAHWRDNKALAFITLPLLGAALWAFWAAALANRPPSGAKAGPRGSRRSPAGTSGR